MTRIGFAYNLKPETSTEYEGQTCVPPLSSNGTNEDEPPSFARDIRSRCQACSSGASSA